MLYDQSTQDARDLEKKTVVYGVERLAREIKYTFSVIKQTVQDTSNDRNHLRSTVRPGSGGAYPIKAPLYAIFMAFFELVVTEQKTPVNSVEILKALKRLAKRMQTGAHYETTENRTHNIDVVKGLVQPQFVARVPPAFGHGPTLLLDFENAVRRSRIESSRYEFKQGILRLDAARKKDLSVLPRLTETVCGIANLGPDADGHVFIGVADKPADATRITTLDGIVPHKINGHHVVGVERESTALGISLDEYVQQVVAHFQNSDLSEPLKTQLLAGFDNITVHGFTVIRILVPRQKDLSFVGNKAFTRNGSSTAELVGQQLVAASKRFPQEN